MGILSQKGLESLLEPLKNKIDNFMPKTGGKFTGPISIRNENNTSTISVEDSYARITSGNTKMDITNNGDILINSKNIFEKDNSLKLGKIVNSNPESNIEDTANSSTYIIKRTNHSIYTSNNKSYTTQNASIIGISDNEYYTEYNENNIVVSNTYPIGTDGTVKVYVVDGGVLNGKELTGSGWTTINILDYM